MNALVESAQRDKLAHGIRVGNTGDVYVRISHDVLAKTFTVYKKIIEAIQSTTVKKLTMSDHYELKVGSFTLSSKDLKFAPDTIGARGHVGHGNTSVRVIYLNTCQTQCSL